MRILDRYIILSLSVSYFMCVGISLLFYSVIDMFSQFHKFVQYLEVLEKSGVKTEPIFLLLGKYYLYHSPIIMYNLSPIVTLMAAMFTITQMSRTKELIPLKACGVSMYRVILPVLVFATIVSGGMIAIQEYAVPRLAPYILSIQRIEYARHAKVSDVQCYDKNKRIFFIGRYIPSKRRLENVRIVIPKEGSFVTIDAKHGTWKQMDGQSVLVVYDGYITHGDDGRYQNPIDAEGYALETDLSEKSILYPEALYLDTYATSTIWERIQKKPESAVLQVTFHNRFSFPLGNIVLILLGLPWILKHNNRNFFLGTAVCILASGIYYGTHLSLVSLGFKELLDPIVACWFSFVLFLSLGVAFAHVIQT